MAAPDRPPDWMPADAPERSPQAPLNLIDVQPRPLAGHRLWVEVEAESHSRA